EVIRPGEILVRTVAGALGEELSGAQHGERGLPFRPGDVWARLSPREREERGFHTAAEPEPGEQGVVLVLWPRADDQHARRRPDRRGGSSPALRGCFDGSQGEQGQRRGERAASSHSAKVTKGTSYHGAHAGFA